MIKKLLISVLLSVLLVSLVFAAEESEDIKLLIEGVKSYKEGNYLGTVQTMEDVIGINPGNALAHYYMAISYVRLGDAEKASEAYNKVIVLSPGSQLAKYSQIGKKIMYPQQETLDQVKQEATPADFYNENVEKEMENRNLKFLIEKINRNKSIDSSEYQKFEDFTPDKSHGGQPDNEEVARALDTLKRAGINPFNDYAKPAMNPEMMQMSMLGSAFGGMGMGGQQNSNPMNMLPMLMMMQQQNGQGSDNRMDPQFMQTMLTNMMMPNMMDFSEKKDY